MAQKEKAKHDKQNPQNTAAKGESPIRKPMEEMSEEEKKREEEMIKRAMAMSMDLEKQKKAELDEEEEMIKRAIELSA